MVNIMDRLVIVVAVEPSNGQETKYTPKKPYSNLLQGVRDSINSNALDKDTFRILTEFLKAIDMGVVREQEAYDYLYGYEEVGMLPPGKPCILQPYNRLKFDLEGRVFLFTDLEQQ